MVMALRSSEAKSSKLCKILKEKIVRKEKLILLLKELLQVKDKTTHENISQQLLTIRTRSLEANASLKKELLLSCSSTKKIVELQDTNRRTIKELESSLDDRRGTLAHLEFQNKQLIVVQRQHEKTIETLKETIKNLEKKAGLGNFVFKLKKKKLKDKSLEDPPPTPASSASRGQEASKPSPETNLISDGILTPASSVSSSIPVAGGPSSPGIGWLDLDSRSNSPTESLPELFNPSHDSVPPLLTPLQSAIEEPPHAGQSLPLLPECGNSEQPVAAVLSGSVNKVEITDRNQLNHESGDSNVQVTNPTENVSDELVDGDRNKVMDRLSPKSQRTSALSMFDLPLIESESEGECSNSRKDHLVTKPQSEISFLNSISESLINDFELTDNSEAFIDQNIASSDVAPNSSISENQVCHLTDETRIRRELDQSEAGGCDKLENSSLPKLLDSAFGNDVPERTASIETQSTSKSDNHTTFGDLRQDVPDTDLGEKASTVEDLNTASGKQLEVSGSPTTNVSGSIDICTKENIDITAQSTDLQASRIEMESPPIHSPMLYDSNDSDPCVSSDDSSPGIDNVREVSSNVSPTSSPQCKLNPSLTSSVSQISCNEETHSSSSEIEDADSEHSPRLTRSNITQKKTSQRVTRQNQKKQMSKIDESPNKCTRQIRQSSTSKSELGTSDRRRSSRINPSLSHDSVSPLLTPIQSAIEELPHAGQSLPLLSECGNSGQPVAVGLSGSVDKVEITDRNQSNPDSGDSNVQVSNTVKNLSDELVDGDRSKVMDRLSPKSQCTSALSMFDLPLIESEGECSNSRKDHLVTKPQSEISFLNSISESLINDFELTDNSEAFIDQNIASSDVAPNSCNSENQVCHLTDEIRIRRELDQPVAGVCDKLENSSLPNLLDSEFGNDVPERTASIETQSTSKSDNHTTIGDLCHDVPDTDLGEQASTVEDLNTASGKQLEVSGSPTTNVSGSIDICTKENIDITAQSTDLQASRIEMESPPIHSPMLYDSNDSDPCVSSDDSSPGIDNVREVSSNVSPTSSPQCKLNPSLTSSVSQISCNEETHSSSSEIEDADSEHSPRLTRSNITPKKTSQRVTRQNQKKQMSKIDESPNKCTRQIRQSSTSKSELGTSDRRRSSRINPSLPHDSVPPLLTPIQSAIEELPHAGQSLPLLSECGNSGQPVAVGLSGSVDKVEITDRNQSNPDSGDSNVQVSNTVKNLSDELVDGDGSKVMDRLSPKSQRTSALSIFDLPLFESESEGVCSNSREEHLVTKPQSEISFLNSISESLINDFELTDNSEASIDQNIASSDVAPNSCNSENQVCHLTDEIRIRRELDQPEAGGCDKLENSSLPNLLDSEFGNDVSERTASIEETQSTSKSDNHTTFGDLPQDVPGTNLIEKASTVDDLNTATGKQLELSGSPTTNVSDSIDICTKENIDITAQSTDLQASRIEMESPPIHSPMLYDSNDSDPCVSSDDSSPGIDNVREVSSSVSPTSSPQCKLNPSLTSSESQIDCNEETHSSSSEIEDADSENFPRLTRSNITLKKTSLRVTRQNPKKQMSKIDESPNKCTRQTRQSSTSKSELGTSERRRSSRINPSLSSDRNSPLKWKSQPLKNSSQPISPTNESPAKSVEVSPMLECQRFSNALSPDYLSTGKKGKRKPSQKMCSQKLAKSTTTPKSVATPGNCHQADPPVGTSSSLTPTKSDDAKCRDLSSTVKSKQLTVKRRASNETDETSSEVEVSGSTPVQNKDSSISSESGESESSLANASADCIRDSNEEKLSYSRHDIVVSPNFAGFNDSDISQSTENARAMPPQKSPMTDSSLDQIRETAGSKNQLNLDASSPPGAIHPSIPILRNENNILCSATAARQSCSNPFSKSFQRCSTVFGAPNLSSFSDLKPEDSRSSFEINQHWSGGAFNPKDARYFMHRQGKKVNDTPEADVDTSQIGELSLSFNLLSINPNNKDDKFYNFFSKFKKDGVFNVDEYSSTFLSSRHQPLLLADSHRSVSRSDRGQFKNYRKGADKLDDSLDTNSEVTIEIKQEDSPFSLKLSVPAGKSLEPVFGSLCGMVREVRSKNAQCGSYRHLARGPPSDPGSCNPIVSKFPGNIHPPSVASFQHSVNRTFLDRSICSQRNDPSIRAKHAFKTENQTVPFCKWGDVTKRQPFLRVVSPNLRSNSTFSTSTSSKSQSEPLKLHQSDVQLKASKLGSAVLGVFNESNKEVNRSINGITPIVDINSVSTVRNYQTSTHPLTDNARDSKSGLGSPNNQFSDPAARTKSKCKSVVLEPSNSSNKKPKKVDIFTPINSSTLDFNRDSQVSQSNTSVSTDSVEHSKNDHNEKQTSPSVRKSSDVCSMELITSDPQTRGAQCNFKQPVGGVTALLKEVPSEHLGVHSLPSIPPVLPVKTCSPTSVSPNATASSSCGITNPRVVGNLLINGITPIVPPVDRNSVSTVRNYQTSTHPLADNARESKSGLGSPNNHFSDPAARTKSKCKSVVLEPSNSTNKKPKKVDTFTPINSSSSDFNRDSQVSQSTTSVGMDSVEHSKNDHNEKQTSPSVRKSSDVCSLELITSDPQTRGSQCNFKQPVGGVTALLKEIPSEDSEVHSLPSIPPVLPLKTCSPTSVSPNATASSSCGITNPRVVGNLLINGITPIVPPVDRNSVSTVRNYQTSTHPLADNARESKSGLGSPNNHFSDPAARTKSKCKSVVLEPSNSTNKKPKKVDTFTPINSSSSDFNRDSQVSQSTTSVGMDSVEHSKNDHNEKQTSPSVRKSSDVCSLELITSDPQTRGSQCNFKQPVGGVTALLKEIPSEDSEVHSLPSIPPVLPLKTCSPTSVSPNATASSSCGITNPRVVGNLLINGITPIVPPVDRNSVSTVRNYQTSTHPLADNARESKSGLGSPNNHFSDPAARTKSKCKSVVLEPSNSSNKKPKKVDTFTPINSSSSDFNRDSQVSQSTTSVGMDSVEHSKNDHNEKQTSPSVRKSSDVCSLELITSDPQTRGSQCNFKQPVGGVTALLKEIPSEDSEIHSLPSIPPVLPVKTCSPTSVSPNATAPSSCGITDPPVIGNKRKIPHSPCKEVSKSKKRCLPLSEEQKSEVFTRQSSSKRATAGSPNQGDVGVMHPPPPKISPNLKKNRGETKPKKRVEPDTTPTISPTKSPVETTATHSTGESLKPAKAIGLAVKGADLKNVAKDQMRCSQCRLTTTLCLCEIERIMAEMILICFTLLTPIPNSPECADVDPIPCTYEEPSYSGALDNENTSRSMENISELPCSPVHDSSAVEMCSSPGARLVEKGASIDQIEKGVSSDEMSDSTELEISPSVEEINVPSGRLMTDSTSVEMCSLQEISTCTMNGDGENQPGILKNDAKSQLLNDSSDSLGGPVSESGTSKDTSLNNKRCLKTSGNSVKRRRLGRKSSDGIKGVNSSNVETPTPEKGNTKNCMNLKKNPETGKLRKVPNKMSAILLEDQCDSSSMNGFTPESVANVIPQKNEQNTSKRRQRSCSSTPASKQNKKSTALRTRRSRAEPTWPECSTDKNSGNSVVFEEDVDLMPATYSTSQSDCLKSHLSSLSPKKQIVELNKNLEVQDRFNESQGDAKFTDSYRGEVQLSKATRSNPICERTSSSEIEKSIDNLLESICEVPGSHLTRSCTERPDHREKPQSASNKSPNPKEVGGRTTFNPLTHLGKFFERTSSAVESTSSLICGSRTYASHERLPSGSDEDSESDMVVDYFSGSESEPKDTPLKSLPKDYLEPSLSSAVEKNETTFYQSDAFVSSRPPVGFYVTAQQRIEDNKPKECDGNNEPNSSRNTINSCQSTTVLEKPSGLQLPKFYTAIDVHSEVAPQEEANPTQLIKIWSNNKIPTEEIRAEDVVPCSINMLAFASFYDLHEPEDLYKFPEPYKRHQERIENSLNEFFHCPNLHDGLKKAVSTLNKMKPYHVGKALCAVAGGSNPKFQPYERNGLASHFSKIQKKSVVLVMALAKGRENYFNEVLSEIEEFLIPSPKSPNHITGNAIINLSAIYSLICRTRGSGLRVQSFIYDLLYGRHISSFKIINQILLTMPQAIPCAQEEMGPLTYTILYLIMKHGVYQNLTPQYLAQSGITPLRNRLSTYYRYSFPPDVTRDAVMEKLMSNVMVKGCDKAIILLSKSQGYKWTFGVVQKYLFPVIDKWINEGEREDDVVVIIKLLGLVSRCFAISVCDSFVTLSLEKFKLIIEKNPSLPVSEAVTEALVHFQRLSPEGVVTILANWTPHDYKITKSAVRTLKNITKSKPYSYWKQFMAS